MKIRWTLIAISFMVLGFCCAAAAADKAVRIGITQIVEHPALDATRQGFIDELAANGFVDGKNVLYEYKNAQNNRPVSGQIARQLVGDKVDLILSISTPSSQDVVAVTRGIPILFSAVTDPLAAGLVKSLESPGGNVSGTTDKSPISRQLDLLLEIAPGVKKLGTVYNSGEASSVASVKELEKEAAKRGITVVRAPATSSGTVKPAAESLVGQVDAIHVPTDNTVVLAIESVVKAAQDNKIPLFAADVDSVARGAIAALAVDYYKLGRQTGAMAHRILEGKAKVSELPVESQKELQLHINPDQAFKMGVTLPESVRKRAARVIK